MKLGASVGRADPKTLPSRARALEDAGVDILWVAELYGFDRPSLMGFLAAVTSRVEIGSANLPFYSRSPALLAMTAAGVDALSGGCCVLGIGASGPQVIEGCHQPNPASRMTAAVRNPQQEAACQPCSAALENPYTRQNMPIEPPSCCPVLTVAEAKSVSS
jgi:alkanesulfonate monooxygenase SsuD/methylene tetrahydromethanopterin reductase-like flavin-dependent oxidoreductase (luciferase family)